MKRKVLSIMFILSILSAVFLTVTITASAEGEYSSGYYTYTVADNRATITHVSSAIRGEVTVPSEFGGYKVTTIGDYAFNGCKNLSKITFPSSLTTIGEGAFCECEKLSGVTLNRGLQTIEAEAFSGTAITSITIPNTVTKMHSVYDTEKHKSALFGTEKLTSVVFENGMTRIPDFALLECRAVTKVVIPSSVTEIGDAAFSWCWYLKEMNLPSGLTKIGNSAFAFCAEWSLDDNLPSGLKEIGNSAFASCKGLTELTMPNSLVSIGDHAFDSCSNLSRITLNRGLKTIGGCAFYESAVKEITIPNTVTKMHMVLGGKYYEGAFFHAYELKSVVFENGITKIPDHALDSCRVKESIVLPDSVTEIGDSAFVRCSYLPEITIPEGVEKIADNAFDGCENLKIRGVRNSAAHKYAVEHGFAFEEIPCKHSKTETVHKESTCIENGEEAVLCIFCGKQIEKNELPLAEHKYEIKNVLVEATCISDGLAQFACTVCGNEKTEAVTTDEHSYGNWTFTKQPTFTEDGERAAECKLCGKKITESVKRLAGDKIVKDPDTGISLEHQSGAYDGEISVKAVKVLDGSAYEILNKEKGDFKKVLFDITTLINGQKVQPNAPVLFGIPLPEGFDKSKLSVYAVTENGALEKIPSFFENGTVCFFASRLSPFAVIDESMQEIQILSGDVNGDGRINSADARLILRAAAKLETLDEKQTAAADVDGNGRVNSSDARLVLRATAKLQELPQKYVTVTVQTQPDAILSEKGKNNAA